jgi:glycosyltransferase involved in cell wall biosynthesis
MIDGLALGAIPSGMLAPLCGRLVALVHHPLCLEGDLAPDRAEALRQSETAALALARAVITTSHRTAHILATDFGVPADLITVAQPGVEIAARAVGSGSGKCRLLSVGSVVPRKAQGLLIEALIALPGRDWHLDVVGSTNFNPSYATEVAARISAADLATHVTLHGAVGANILEQLYHRADLFVLASRYEGYGMVLSEAIIRGLPIICTTGCGAADTLPAAALRLVPQGDPSALSEVLQEVMSHVDLRNAMAEAAWSAGKTLPRWTDTANCIVQTLRKIGVSVS